MSRLAAACVSAGMLLAILYGSLTDSPPGPEIPHLDKLLHFLTYAVLAAWHGVLLPKRRPWILAGCCLWGLAMECLQALTGYREASVADMIMNALGVLAGLYFAHRSGIQLLRHAQQG